MQDVEKLLRAIDAAEEHSYGSDSDSELSSDRARSIELYLGKNTDPAPEGRSQVVDRSVFETIQWILPSLCRIFANGDDVVSIPPEGPEDEAAAKQEEQYLNYILTQKNPWFEIFLTWATDAMLSKNAYALAYSDTSRQVEVERYERQTEEGMALLLNEPGVELVAASGYPDEEAPPQPVMQPDPMGNPVPVIDPMTGQPVMQPPPMLYDVELRRVDERKKVCINVLPPERVKVSEKTPSFRLRDCSYFEYWDNVTLSDLRAMGYDVPDEVAADPTADTEEDEARDQYGNWDEQDNSPDPSMRRVKARWIWIKHDFDGDGIAELNHVLRVGQTIYYREEVSRIPVASIVPSPLPHRHIGLSIADMVEDIQRIKTAILRQGLDNLYLSNNPTKVLNPNVVNLDDALISRPGGIQRADDVNAIRYEIPPFVFPQAMEGLEYMDQVRENRTGTNRYFTGIDQNALNKTATGIQQLSTMAAQRVEQIARVIAFGVEDLASIVHELVLKAGHKQEVVKMQGQWVEIDPAQWRKRTDFRISVAFAAGNKDALTAKLQMIAMMQTQALQLGLPIVQPQNVYATMLELCKASDFSTPERFWTDPIANPPQPQGPDPALMIEQSKLELQNKQIDTDAALKNKEIETRASTEMYRIDTDAKVKLATQHISAQQGGEDAAKKGADKAVNPVVKGMDTLKSSLDEALSKISDESEATKAEFADALAELVKRLDQVEKAARAPKKIVRGADGKISEVVPQV